MTARLEIRDLSVRFGRLQALAGVSLDVAAGTVVGLIGPNGAGKTTLLDAVSGFVPASGRVTLEGVVLDSLPPARRATLGLGRTFQSLELFEDLTVEEHLQVAAEAAGRPDRDGPDLGRLGLEGLGGRLPAALSSARQRRLALARALAGRPRLLLLDEPAAGLDRAERRALAGLVRQLAAGGTGVVLADHDMALVLDVCDEVCVLDGGRVIATGPPATVRVDAKVVAAYLGTTSDDEPAPAAPPPPTGPPAGGGAPALAVDRLTTGYRGTPVVREISLHVAPGEVVALLGANGAGKTTTLLAAAGVLPVDDGEVRVLGRPVAGGAHRVARRGLTLVPQGRALFGGLTAGENLRLAARGDGAALEAVVEDLPALRPLLGRRAGLLSGGEQQLLAIGRGLAARPRLLLVDELSLGLAPRLVAPVLARLRALASGTGTAVLVVEQHVRPVLAVADRAYVLRAGRVVLEGSAAELAARPERLEAAYLGS